jgi:hypothetical protein
VFDGISAKHVETGEVNQGLFGHWHGCLLKNV